MTATPIARRTRATTIQVPGEAPKQPEEMKQPEPDAFAASQGAAPVAFNTDHQPSTDIEALRAQIRAEEQANARAELGAQIQAAASVVNQPASASTIAGNRSNYRTMRAADIDHTRLTAPVLSLDGWVCPPAPEAKK